MSRALLGDAAAGLPADTVQALAALSEAAAALESGSADLSTPAGATANQRARLLVTVQKPCRGPAIHASVVAICTIPNTVHRISAETGL